MQKRVNLIFTGSRRQKTLPYTEGSFRSSLLEISQNSQENNCARVFFNKVTGLKPATLTKKEILAQVFSCEFCEISRIIFFTEHLWTTASDHCCHRMGASWSNYNCTAN